MPDNTAIPAAAASWTTQQLIDQIVEHRPVWFRHELPRFRGERRDLHAALLDLLKLQKTPLARAHAGMVLMCVGHESGTEVFLEALCSSDAKTRPPPCDGCPYAMTCHQRQLACWAFAQHIKTGRWQGLLTPRVPSRRPYLRLFRH